jgi:hypothetical protein
MKKETAAARRMASQHTTRPSVCQQTEEKLILRSVKNSVNCKTDVLT